MTTLIARLTPSQRQRVLDHYRDTNIDYRWWDCTVDDIKETARLIGLDLDNIYWDQYWNVTLKGSYRYKDVANLLVRHERPQDHDLHEIADDLHAAQPLPYAVSCVLGTAGRDYQTVECEVDTSSGPGDYQEIEDDFCTTTERIVDERVPYPDSYSNHEVYVRREALRAELWKTFPYKYDEGDFKAAFSDFAHWCRKQLEAEYDYLTSDEAVADYVECNVGWEDLVELLGLEEDEEVTP